MVSRSSASAQTIHSCHTQTHIFHPVSLRSIFLTIRHRPDNDEGPTVSDLADKIKALKAAHSIEATPQRTRQKHSTAEEPVTARIRRRTETAPAADPQNAA
jgi:hypothetical protein